MLKVELKLDVSSTVDLGEPAHVAATIVLPDPEALPATPVVCFAKPGGGYSRGYYTADLPGPAKGAQADWHVERGWIFVAIDHLGVGDSSLHAAEALNLHTVAAGNHAAEQKLLSMLAEGALSEGYPRIVRPVTIGIGQSMGGCMTVVQQGRYHCYDGIGVLGKSAVHTLPPPAPGEAPIVMPWYAHDRVLAKSHAILNQAALDENAHRAHGMSLAWSFHYDDVPEDVVRADLESFGSAPADEAARRERPVMPWASLTFPGAVAAASLTPGIIAAEAAAVRVPVLVAMGERDTIPDPRGELRAYMSANSVDFFVCPRMGHMHNFAGTRVLFWERIHAWAQWVCLLASRERG